MNALTKSNQSEGLPVRCCQKHTARPVPVILPLLRCVNPGTLAVVMFVTLAALSPIRGKGYEDAGSAAANQGYLQVYSATDESDDGGTMYYAHSSYTIYTSRGKLFANVENHISRSDEIPTLVTLPAGSYTIEARSERGGYVRVPIVITAGRRTVLDPDEGQTKAETQLSRTKRPPHFARAGA